MSNTMSETLQVFLSMYTYFIERFKFTIPQEPEKKLEEPTLAFDLNVRSACPFGPNIGKSAAESLIIEFLAYKKNMI